MGRYADREKNLLTVYALLEAGIAVFALLFAPTLSITTEIHIFFERLAPSHPAFAHFIHFFFAVILLIPPAICMGGTFRITSYNVCYTKLLRMSHNRQAFEKSPALYYSYVEPRQGAGKGLLEALGRRSCVVVTDDFPAFFLPQMRNNFV